MKMTHDDLEVAVAAGTISARELADLETWANVHGDEHDQYVVWVDYATSAMGVAVPDEGGRFRRDANDDLVVIEVMLPEVPDLVRQLLDRLASAGA